MKKKNFLELGAFSDKQYCKNCRACNFLAIRLTISLLNDVDIKLILEFKTVLKNMTQPFPKILNKGTIF